MRIFNIVEEPLKIMGKPAAERKDRVLSLLQSVGIDRNMVDRFPHEFSGGQRQRIGIARALISDPKFVVCDEPVSALDVSIQGQVVNLLMDLQRDFGLTYLFVSHDLRVVRHVSDRVAVMYLGVIVEIGRAKEIYEDPRHPYTKALLAAVPRKRREVQAKPAFIGGDIPSARNSRRVDVAFTPDARSRNRSARNSSRHCGPKVRRGRLPAIFRDSAAWKPPSGPRWRSKWSPRPRNAFIASRFLPDQCGVRGTSAAAIHAA